jgi:NADH dehydrogenase [ubiquinone] 1 alpha subcomplex assembly factor 5
MPAHKRRVPDLFDMRLRALRQQRASRLGPELFLYERAFADCLDRAALIHRRFERALLVGCRDPSWPERLGAIAGQVQTADLPAEEWQPDAGIYDIVMAIGTLDTENNLPLTLRLIRHVMRGDALFLGALSGGDTLPQLRAAMRAADAISGVAAPHVHPRIEPSALAPLLTDAGFIHPVIDVDRALVSYTSLDRLIADLRSMGATNILSRRPPFIGKAARAEATRAFAAARDNERTVETFEIIHFAAWSAKER